ncbi:MAG: double-strand break repair protein AddB [Rhodobacteraceae bacterium]|nr:double-strand break repair protein AddB [Paracoccaceae bacterium]
MFDPQIASRVFALPSGVDFPKALMQGLLLRTAGHPPEALARVRVIVNTERMRRRLRALFDGADAVFLPRIELLTDVADPLVRARLPRPVPALRRRLELAELVRALLDVQPDLAARASAYDLAQSLADLMEEMRGEGTTPDDIAALDVTDQSGHWARAQSFLNIVSGFFEDSAVPDRAGWQRLAVEATIRSWKSHPPQDPVILAGSTGSRGTTALLMRAVAKLPQGAVVLPGFDFDMPQAVWDQLSAPLRKSGMGLAEEDHPQFRFARLLHDMQIMPQDVASWTDTAPPSPGRNQLVSLALRPAPVTDRWLAEGPALPQLDAVVDDLTLVEAASSREEALAIALRLRKAAEDGQTAALITPDRMLTRQVTAALDRWGILPDDSAGVPMHLTPPGRFLRHVAALDSSTLTAETLLTLLKHPLTHSGANRNLHLLHTRDLELMIRRKGWPFPDRARIRDWATARGIAGWGEWVIRCFLGPVLTQTCPLTHRVLAHVDKSERIARGSSGAGAGELWQQKAGQKARSVVDDLIAEAGAGGDMDARDYADLFGAILAGEELRDRDAPHPDILIWGTLEARVMGAELLILGSLNEGSWPELPGADPWLNRKMRSDAGMLLPERRVGLSAHDFQQALAGPKVWLTRSVKTEDAESVPSRWLNRLTNLMSGLPDRNGPEALGKMRQRGAEWLALARALDAPRDVPAAARPSPAPPAISRPARLSVTEIKRLIRDPYAIYARHVLRLRPLEPLQRQADALARGIVIHDILEKFVRGRGETQAHLMAQGQTLIWEQIPWPVHRHLWLARLDRVAEWFVTTEAERRLAADPAGFEVSGKAYLGDLDFTLTAKADRIDLDALGQVLLYDYKTGAAPTAKEQKHFDKQLLLEAAMAEEGAFDKLGPHPVLTAQYLSLARSPKAVPAPLDDLSPSQVWDEFKRLIAHYRAAPNGFSARRAMFKDDEVSDYDQLARYGEWDITEMPKLERLT